MNISKRLSPAFILLAAFLWGLTGLFVRTLNSSGLSNMTLLFARSSVTAISIFTYLAIRDKNQLKIAIRDWWYFFGSGVLSFTLFGFCYFYTIENSHMSIAAILLYTSPFFVMLMAAVFFGEKITAVKIISLFTAAVGCILICGTGYSAVSPLIVLIGLASGFCYALYSIFARIALRKYSSLTVTAYTFLFAAVCSFFFADHSAAAGIFIQSPEILILTVIFAFISAVFPYALYTSGLKHTDTGKASIMATFEAVVAAFSGIIVFHESITIAAVFGIALVLFAVWLLNKK